MLRVAILNCDFIKKEFAETYGQYPEMFRHVIKKSGLTFVYESFNILDFDYPTSLNDFDLYLITGSKASVYDDEEWILNLFEFVKSLDNAKKNILGFCFGHQVIAQALGGHVQKHPQGWHVGANELITSDPAFNTSYQLLFSHQDQVIKLPNRAKLIGSAKECKFCLMKIDNHILSTQAHIELSNKYASELYESRKELIGNKKYSAAMNSMKQELDTQQFTNDVFTFFLNQ